MKASMVDAGQIKEFSADDFEAIITCYGSMVYRLAMVNLRHTQDSEDCYQEVFLRYVEHWRQIQSMEHAKAWLIRVTLNYCRSLLRSSARTKTAELSDALLAIRGEEDPDIGQIHEAEAMRQAMSRLSEEEATCIHLYYYEELSIKEIADLTGSSESAIKVRLYRARKKLKGGLA